MTDDSNKTTHAQRRKKERREALIDELKAREYLRQLGCIDRKLRKDWKTLGNEQISALRLRADIQFRRLAKVLPDRKAIEGEINFKNRDVTDQPLGADEWEKQYSEPRPN